MRSLALLICVLFATTLAAAEKHGFSASDRAWWAVQPVGNPKPPDSGTGWARNGIDHFVARKLQKANLQPAREADRLELIRRACFDLHGLPPTPEQAEAFIKDERPDAWERLLQSLLNSPRYGEQWAQHWLDVVRYAESDGYRQDAFRPGAHYYRDYVIKSFNDDKPYDQFVREQLAGDEIDSGNPELLTATGFLRHGIYEYNQRNARMHWELIMNEMTSVTGEVFLGLGVGCAQCHDHKFDPILQKDFYALQAFLGSTVWPTDTKLATPKQLSDYNRQHEEWDKATREIREEMNSILGAKHKSQSRYAVEQFPEDIQKMYNKPRADRTPYEQQLVMLVDRQVDWSITSINADQVLKGKADQLKRYRTLETRLKKFEELKPKPLPLGFTATDVGTNATKTFIKSRQGSEEVKPAFLTLLEQKTPSIKPSKKTTGRRTALAQWIADEDNQLSTRVIANRIWQYHFGHGIVATPNDFGTLGEEPSHPELLDWLTRRLIEGGWKMKEIHALVMNSATYRQTARREPGKVESNIDPGNRLLWRFAPRRLDAEEVRDAMLAVSGELKHQEGGASVNGTSPYRSVYVKKLRNTPDQVLHAFDSPAGFDSAPNRISTTTPTQSLLLVNGNWTLSRSRAFAKRVMKSEASFGETEIRQAYQLAYNRNPGNQEMAAALAFIKHQETHTPAPPEREDKFPNETGLRPVTQVFSAVKDVKLGDKSLWIQPGSRFERLQLPAADIGDEFTLEAVVNLDRIQEDASVNTLISCWNGNNKNPGWSLGVTSKKSSYKPQSVIVQLIGENHQGNTTYEVVPSDLKFPLGKPVYVAATVSARTSAENKTAGTVTFYLKDLSDPKAPLETRTVRHSVVRKVAKPQAKVLAGGRDQAGHLWDGQMARLSIAKGKLNPNQLIVGENSAQPERVIDWVFGDDSGEQPAPGATWFRPPPADNNRSSARLIAVTDFCHALLNSNEFLYLH